MPIRPDPELEQFKRTVDLVEYAKSSGYTPRSEDGARGLTVLDHPNRDCIVVGHVPNGPWIYASVPDYAPRASGEPEAQATARLRRCIDRTKDRGSIVEFVERSEPRVGGAEVSIEIVRERLRAFRPNERRLESERVASAPVASPDPRKTDKSELSRRRYDWSPLPEGAPRETEVERRLRRWREAQASLTPTPPAAPLRTSASLPPPAPERPSFGREPADVGSTIASRAKSELARRRYDWTPPPGGVDALARGPRGRSGGWER